ncbi:MAG: nitronate monooxygenase [Nevskia sp.]|nr:nitronate monooxygenase [Nevskia sp.]
MLHGSLAGRLYLPLIAAPMFLASGPELVIAACRSGIVGAFPALNQRSTEGYARWLDQIEAGLAQGPLAGVAQVGPHAVNLVVHKTNQRLQADLKLTVERRVPVVITSLGAAREVVEAVHSYGGLVFHDVISVRHGEKALAADVDGIIAVCGGAGGHGGTLNPFAFLYELRRLTDKTLILAGALSTGRQVAAAVVAGADLVSMGTRFIGTQESPAAAAYKQLLLETSAGDIVYTPKITGVNASFIARSLRDNGIDLDRLGAHGAVDMAEELGPESKAWRDIWSAGHGVGAVRDLPPAAELIRRMRVEYSQALDEVRARA